jgi:hypothetical protein
MSGNLEADEFGRLLNGVESLVWDVVTRRAVRWGS